MASSSSSSVASPLSLATEWQHATNDLCTDPALYAQLATKYACVVCTVLEPAVYVTSCLHVVCQTCAEKLTDCPYCSAPLVMPRVAHNALVSHEVGSSLRFRCVYGSASSGGSSNSSTPVRKDTHCSDILTFTHWLDHCNTKCGYRPRTCLECSVVVTVGTYASHVAQECKARFVDCPKCPQTHIHVDAMAHHNNVDCLGAVRPCRYATHGCTVTGTADKLALHCPAARDIHLDLVSHALAATQRRLSEMETRMASSSSPPSSSSSSPPSGVQVMSENKEGGDGGIGDTSLKRPRTDTVVVRSSSSRRSTEAEERWKILETILAIPNIHDRPHVLVADSKNGWYIGVIRSRYHISFFFFVYLFFFCAP